MSMIPPDTLALVNGSVVLPDGARSGLAVVVSEGRIAALLPEKDLPAGIERMDTGGRWITPGLIDLHTHGALSHSFNEPDEQAFTAITVENARRGVTSLLATLAPVPLVELLHDLDFIRAWMSAPGGGTPPPGSILPPRPGAQVLGAHLESPYTHPAQCGALDPACLRLPEDGSYQPLLAYNDVLRIFVLAPELPGALELVQRLAEKDIIPAAGHTTAKEEQIVAAMRCGLRHVTHLFSAMSTTVREGPWRKPGLLETALVYEGLSVEMIADNRHLPPTLMKLAYRSVGPQRLCLVSDATNGAGLPDGSRFSMGAKTYEVADGVGMMLDRSSFAGSTTLLNQMVPILRDEVGVPLHEAVNCASLNPARVLGIEARKGSLAPGKDADIAIFDNDSHAGGAFNAWRTMIAGQWVYSRYS